MDHSFLVELESGTRAQQASTAPSAEWTEPQPSLFAQVEQLLGGDSEPDPAFFIDSWTVGVAAASENFLRRRQDQKNTQKNREHAVPAFHTICSFPPFITMEEPLQDAELLNEAEPPTHNADLSTPHPNPSPRGAEPPSTQADLPSWNRELPPLGPFTGPLTLHSARRLLGVTAASTRDEVKAAYRQMASLYHPDHLARHGDDERHMATDRMASINEAYRLLSEARPA